MSQVNERLVSAVHEAGHAVVATLLGVPFDTVGIISTGGGGLMGDPTGAAVYGLIVVPPASRTAPLRRLCRSSLLIAVGGAVAVQAAVVGTLEATVVWNQWRRSSHNVADRGQASVPAEILCPDDPSRAEREAVTAATTALRCPVLAGSVVAVAGALLTQYLVDARSIRLMAPMLRWSCDACPSESDHRRPFGPAWRRTELEAALAEATAIGEAHDRQILVSEQGSN